ncbi:MAG: hypothetical protein J6A19_00800, partial [Oscillospiraceae bacterium]|nr:hypothetical protein [Oscillospiraceae bacterium]
WWGFAPHPTSFCAKRKRKAFFRASRGSRRRAYPPDKFQYVTNFIRQCKKAASAMSQKRLDLK